MEIKLPENQLFYCEHILDTAQNEELIQQFTVNEETGKGLETFLKKYAISEELSNETRTY